MNIRRTLGVDIIRVLLKKAVPYTLLFCLQNVLRAHCYVILIKYLITMSYRDDLFPFVSSISYPLSQRTNIRQ